MLDNLGEMLKIIRIVKDYTIKSVNESTKLSTSYISDAKNGRRK